MKKYKCTKCYEIIESKKIEPKFKIGSDDKIESEVNKDNQEKLIYKRVCKKCGGPVIEIDPEVENYCNQRYKRWEKIKEKLPKTELPSIKNGEYKPNGYSDEEMKELNDITEELAKNYLDYLSIDGRFDIEQRMAQLGKKLR